MTPFVRHTLTATPLLAIPLLAAILGTALTAAFAADSADLSVRGTIKPSACKPMLSGGAVVDFGVISASTLSATSATRFAAKRFTLTIDCDAATQVVISTIDGRKGTVNDLAGQAITATEAVWYGIGTVDGKTIGAYTMSRDAEASAIADGADVAFLHSEDGGVTWRGGATDWAQPETRLHAWSSAGASAPGAFKAVTQHWRLDFALGRTDDMPALTNEVAVDGLVTFQVKYL